MKQTAVAWLIDQLDIDLMDRYWTIEKAKEIEKEQMIEAMNRSLNKDFYCEYDNPEQYYEKIYKNKQPWNKEK